jgi:hypothetical protein
MSKKKILILVEGAKTDVLLMQRLFSVYRISDEREIVSYCTNIYVLYQEMFHDGVEGFDELDLLQVLKSREKDPERKVLFDERYTDVLLIFDLDPHDPLFDESHIKLMQEYFCESSDMGKLYLNYPMVEAFYHMPTIPDETYIDKTASLVELRAKRYKLRVNRESKGHDYNKFAQDKNEFTTVILQNLSKAWHLSTGQSLDWKEIQESIPMIDLNTVLSIQLQYLKRDRLVYVLCTCAFYIVDYNPKFLDCK